MKTLIIGAGVVGYNIAARLVTEGHDVTVVDSNPATLAHLSSHLDVRSIRGYGSHPQVLLEADVSNAQMVVAVTDSDEVNMVACTTASILGNDEIIKIARVREPSYADPRILSDPRYDLDLVINPEQVTAERILALLRFPDVSEVLEFAEGRIQLIGIRVKPTSPLAGVRLVEMADRFPAAAFLVAATIRNGEVIIPRGDTVILPSDEVYLVAAAEDMDAALDQVGVSVAPVRRIMILGGSRTGEFLAQGLESRGVKPKLIEADRAHANYLADVLPETTVIHGSPTDAELLQEENAGEMHAVIVCDDREETNLMAALLAHQMGSARIIATTNEAEYRSVIKSIGIDVCLSPQMIAVSSILRFIREGRVIAVQAIGDGDAAEVLEFEAQLASDAVGTALQELRLPRGALIVALVRDDTVLVPRGKTVIQEGDHVVVLAQKQAVSDIERLLQCQVEGA